MQIFHNENCWHHPATSSYSEVLDAGVSEVISNLDRQIINLSTIQTQLLLIHAESSTIPIAIDCSNLLTINDEDTLAARLSNRIFEALSLELPEVNTVSILERELSKLRTSTQKNILLCLYSQATPRNIQTLLQSFSYNWLYVRHISATTREEILNQIQECLLEIL